MRVALIIPTCDRPQLVRRAVRSAIAQDSPFAEIVVVNDGASEGPVDAVGQGVSLVRLVKTAGYEGLTRARIKGLDSLSDSIEAVCYLDDDDELLSCHSRLLAGKLAEGHQFAFSIARFSYPDGSDTTDPEPSNPGPKRYYDPSALLEQNIAPVSSFMHLRGALTKVGGWDDSVLRMEDWDLWGRMFLAFGPPSLVNEVTNVIHKGHGANLTDSNRFTYAMACSWRDIVSDRLRHMKATACQVVTDAIRTTFNPPRVAVVMPVYNAEKHLRQAMDSILAQDYQGFEVIAVNDASTDGSRRILDEYSARDRRVRIFDLEENSGVTKALNLGLLASRSEYVARMDADDFSEPSRLGKQVAFLDKNRGVGVLGTKFLSMDESLSKTTWVNNVETSPSDVASALRRYCCIGHPTVMMRRRVVEVVGGYSEAPEHEAVEDYELWTRASRKFKLANLPDFLLKYRQHAGQVSRTLSERQKKNFEAVRKAYAEREHGNGDGR